MGIIVLLYLGFVVGCATREKESETPIFLPELHTKSAVEKALTSVSPSASAEPDYSVEADDARVESHLPSPEIHRVGE